MNDFDLTLDAVKMTECYLGLLFSHSTESKMKIEVALPTSATTKQRGDLLESLAEKLLTAQSYEVIKEIRFTAVELDLLCRHKVNGKEIYVECKAYRDKNIDANILKNLAGTRVLKDYSEAWLISTSDYGKEAKGFISEWQAKPKELASSLSFYTPDMVINSLISSGIIKSPPNDKAEEFLGSENLIGEWVLLITAYGNFWAAAILSGGIPSSVICYYAKNNELVKDNLLLQKISATDTTLSDLDFTFIDNKPKNEISKEEIIDVALVQTGEEWSDYRPARPKDFVGRTKDINYIYDFFKKIANRETNTRVFALTGDSGMGKSSLIAKIVSKSKNQSYKNKHFIYAVDVRAATTPNYIYSALLQSLKEAQRNNFGNKNIELTISDVSNPLNSESIRTYLASLAQQQQLIVLIFDQFEELYSKVDLYDVFNRAKSLLLCTAALKENFCLGFAWKSDSTTHSEHPAYFFWHELSDYRLTRKLSPFSDGESNAVVNIFEKEINQRLHNDLRHNIIVSSQGYPWLLKKLCIHLYEKINSGVEQTALLENRLNIASLFNNDLKELNQAERTCLNFVAEKAPVDWFEVIELSGSDTLSSLIHRRLVIRSGDRLNIYWDIFREYILTGRVPVIPLRYLPSTDFSSVYKVANVLQHDHPLSVQNIVDKVGLSEGTVMNIGSDINMFEIATRESGEYLLNRELEVGNELGFLRKIREKFKKHAFTLALQSRTLSTVITANEAIGILKNIFHNSTYADKTWHTYTIRLCRWLEICGFLSSFSNGWIYRDQGDVVADRVKTPFRIHSGKIFTAAAPPTTVLETLEWIIHQESIVKKDPLPKGYRNALSVLARFFLIIYDQEKSFPNIAKIGKYPSLKEAIWVSANTEQTLVEVVKLIDIQGNISNREIGHYMAEKYALPWSESSKKRTGGALKTWAHWLNENKNTIKLY